MQLIREQTLLHAGKVVFFSKERKSKPTKKCEVSFSPDFLNILSFKKGFGKK